MGIQGLLPFVKEATQPINIRKYAGYAVAVDTYCWLHKGAFACSLQLAKGEPTDVYVRYCLKIVNMMRSMDVRPILVFDGCRLPAKKHVEQSRRERRELYNKKGRQFLREGKVNEARDCFNKCVNVTPEMALQVIKAARSLGVDCIVAPYEADAQLAYLHKTGIVQAVITEDSDLITFGCNRVIVKLDLNGNGLEIDSSKLDKAMKIGTKYTPEKFRYMCIIAGCDYLQSLPGIGLGKARKLFQLSMCPDLSRVVRRMPQTLNMKLTVPAEYIDGFHRANNTFLYQLAFDPRRRKLVPLNPYEDGMDPTEMEYAGKYLESQQAYQVALGNMNINNMEKIDDFKPERTKPYDRSIPRHKLSIWHKEYRPGPDLNEENPKEVERPHTIGKEVQLKMKACKRPREDDDLDQLPTDNDLQSWYGGTTPNIAKRRPQPLEPETIPETPSPCKVKRSQQIVADKLLQKARSPKKSPVSRRNMFAVKGRKVDREKRLQQLKGDTVRSRFFNPPEDMTEQVEDEDDVAMDFISRENYNSDSHELNLKVEPSSDDEEPSDDTKPLKAEWAFGDAEPSTSKRQSALDNLKIFRRDDQVLFLGTKVKKAPKPKFTQKEINVLDLENKVVNQIKEEGLEIEVSKSSQLSSQSRKVTPKGSAFNWNKGGGLKKSNQEKKTTSALSLVDRFGFKRPSKASSMSSKMERNEDDTSIDIPGSQTRTNQNQDDFEASFDSNEQNSLSCSGSERIMQDSEQDMTSQNSYSAGASQTSVNMYSMDADALSYSQFSISRQSSLSISQNTTQDDSQQDEDCESQDETGQNLKNEKRYSDGSNQSIPKLPSMEDDVAFNEVADCKGSAPVSLQALPNEVADFKESTLGSLQALPKLPSIQDFEIQSDTQDTSVNDNLIPSRELFTAKETNSSQLYSLSNINSTKSESSTTDDKLVNGDEKTSKEFFTAKKTKSSPFYSISNNCSTKSKSLTQQNTKKRPDVTTKLSSYFTKSKCDQFDSQEESFSEDQKDVSSSEEKIDSEVEQTESGIDQSVIDLTDEDSTPRDKRKEASVFRRSLSSSKLQGACKPSGLSKKRKKPGTSKKTDENSSKQTSMMAFLKKSNTKSGLDKKPHVSDGPMSPVKTNIQDVTPESDNSIVKKDVKKVQRVIFS